MVCVLHLCVGGRLGAVKWRRGQVQPAGHQSGEGGAQVFSRVQQRRQGRGQDVHSSHDRRLQDLLDGNLQQVPVFSIQRVWEENQSGLKSMASMCSMDVEAHIYH